MKITNEKQIKDFMDTIDRCKNKVELRSTYGDIYNLKSKMSEFIAIGALLKEHGDELELFCSDREDEYLFHEFFNAHPEVLGFRSEAHSGEKK